MNNVNVATSQTSSAYWLKEVYGVAIQAVFTGSPVGVISLEGSCDAGSQLPNEPILGTGVNNWTTIADSPQNVTGAGSVTYNFTGVFYKWIRVVYTATSGTGNMTVTVNSKGA